jgi:hypothetical protein
LIYALSIRRSTSCQNISQKPAAGIPAALFHPFLNSMSHCQRSRRLWSMTPSMLKKSIMVWFVDVVFPVNSCFYCLYSYSIANLRSYSCAGWIAFSCVTCRFVA